MARQLEPLKPEAGGVPFGVPDLRELDPEHAVVDSDGERPEVGLHLFSGLRGIGRQ